MFGRRMHGEAGRTLSGGDPGYRTLELSQPLRELDGRVIYFLPGGGFSESGRFQQRIVCHRGNRFKQTAETIGARERKENCDPASASTDYIRTKDASLHGTGTPFVFDPDGVARREDFQQPGSVSYVV